MEESANPKLRGTQVSFAKGRAHLMSVGEAAGKAQNKNKTQHLPAEEADQACHGSLDQQMITENWVTNWIVY